MKKMRTLFAILVMASLLLAGCGPSVEDVVAELNCVESGSCTISVHNTYGDPVDYTVNLAVESAGVPIGERIQYPNTDARRHDYWFYQFHGVFDHKDTAAQDEVESYIVDSIDGVGQTLVKLTVRVEKNGFSDPLHIHKYALINFPNPNAVDAPIRSSLTCSGGRVQAITHTSSEMPELTMGIYFTDVEDTPHRYVVASGSYSKVEIPIPEGTEFIELDVLGHRIEHPYGTVIETHMYRVYCIPEY